MFPNDVTLNSLQNALFVKSRSMSALPPKAESGRRAAPDNAGAQDLNDTRYGLRLSRAFDIEALFFGVICRHLSSFFQPVSALLELQLLLHRRFLKVNLFDHDVGRLPMRIARHNPPFL